MTSPTCHSVEVRRRLYCIGSDRRMRCDWLDFECLAITLPYPRRSLYAILDKVRSGVLVQGQRKWGLNHMVVHTSAKRRSSSAETSECDDEVDDMLKPADEDQDDNENADVKQQARANGTSDEDREHEEDGDNC
jgi:hypothetical protein